ncbi:hypothetical protein M33023_00300 [Candidatus Phytoplasma asteris]|uniref:Uncharacterized protein n=1 Tax=Candidatus Phytoplasma asteris TaxID=85620 RepID=A0ABZ2YEE9_9MOLU
MINEVQLIDYEFLNSFYFFKKYLNNFCLNAQFFSKNIFRKERPTI